MTNQIKTVLLLTILSAIFLFIGYALGGRSGMMTALIFSLIMNFGAYWFSDKIVLAMHQAKEIGAGHPSGVYQVVKELAAQAKLPMPKVYVVPQMAPNAFATGRNPEHAVVAVTEGILQMLNERELRGVLAHEMSHIKNRDILVSTIVAAIASAIMYLAHMMRWVGAGSSRSQDREGRGVNPLVLIFTIVLAPLVATLIQTAISRTREFMADESGSYVSQDPEALAAALEKISDPQLIQEFRRRQLPPDIQPAFAHLYIVNHFSGEALMSLFSTHPPTKERVKRLHEIATKLSARRS